MHRDDDIDKELQFHVDQRVADYVASGLTPAEATASRTGIRRRHADEGTDSRSGFVASSRERTAGRAFRHPVVTAYTWSRRFLAQGYPPLNDKGFTVFAVRHGSSPGYPMSAIVADVRRGSASSVSTRASTAWTPTALACLAAAPAGSSHRCSVRQPIPGIRRPPTPCSGNPAASRRSWRTFRPRISLDGGHS
jgi:hypothetical protein